MISLNERIYEHINDKKYQTLSNGDRAIMEGLLTNTALAAEGKILGESTLSGDIAKFTPILMPIVRRVYPALVANQLLGIQPLTMPTGYIYAMTNRYLGNKTDGPISPADRGQILVFEAAVEKGDTVNGTTSSAQGKVIHIENEGKVALVQLLNDKKFQVETADKGTKITAVYSNESTFNRVLKDYAGPLKTDVGEKIAEDMATIGFGIERVSVEAQTRKLKAEYTLEMYEDLRNQHGILADEHLANLISAELQTEIDREVISFVNNTATVVPDVMSPGETFKDHGRWELERYRANAVRIDLESRNIGIRTKRGAGNILLVSPKVATMLDQIGSFKLATNGTEISNDIFTGTVGVYNGRHQVIVDQWADSDYITVLYKGGMMDAIGYFCPYVPLSFQSVTNAESGQPAIIARTRYGLVQNPQSAEDFGRTFAVDLTGTVLA